MDQISASEIDEKVKEFQNWIQNQPELPQNIEKLLLLRFLKVSRWNVEKSQRFLKHSIELRDANPHIFSNRDPLSPEIKNVFKKIDMVPLMDPTPENYKVIVMRLIDSNLDDVEFNDVIKAFFIMADSRLITPDSKTLSDGEVPIFDMSGVSYRHLTKIVISTVRLYMKYTQEAHPVRVRHLHIINCNPIIDKIMFLIRPFVRAENFKMINFHTPGSETLYKFVPKECLPMELGGSGGSILVMKAYWLDRIEKLRDYLMNDNNWRLTEDENNNEIKNGSGGVLDFLF